MHLPPCKCQNTAAERLPPCTAGIITLRSASALFTPCSFRADPDRFLASLTETDPSICVSWDSHTNCPFKILFPLDAQKEKSAVETRREGFSLPVRSGVGSHLSCVSGGKCQLDSWWMSGIPLSSSLWRTHLFVPIFNDPLKGKNRRGKRRFWELWDRVGGGKTAGEGEDAGEQCFSPGCGCCDRSFHRCEEEVGTHMLALSPTQLGPLWNHCRGRGDRHYFYLQIDSAAVAALPLTSLLRTLPLAVPTHCFRQIWRLIFSSKLLPSLQALTGPGSGRTPAWC